MTPSQFKTEMNYLAARQIAEQKGQAEAQMAKDVQSAEREKKLAEIEASKLVEVEKLNKEQTLIQMAKEKEAAEIEAAKIKAVAEIQKQTEAANLEKIKLLAEQEIERAKAKKQSIELSGAITEVQKAELELQRQIAQYKWEGISKGLAGLALPTMLTINNGSGKGQNGSESSLDKLINAVTLEKINGLSDNTGAAK